MMRLFGVLALLGLVAGLIWGIAAFLAPDDLAVCPNGPDASHSKCQKADAIIAISGGDTQARTAEAVRLYKAGWADRLIFSGAAFDTDSPSNARAMRRQAIASGVPVRDISIEELARDTEENATRTRQLAEREGWRRIILVTSGYHQRRASVEFKRVFESTVVVSHPVPSDRQWSQTWWATPVGWYLAVSELIKTIVVSLKGIA